MVEQTTQHYGFTKPEVTKSASTWGGFLNSDLDSLDALIWANQQGLAPIGSISMFAGATAPTNWMICDGSALDKTVAANTALFDVIGYAFGGSGNTFNLPQLQQRFPIGALPAWPPLASTGGNYTYTITTANMPAHSHAASQDGHSHYVYQDVHSHSDSGHVHGASVSQDPHQHGGNIMRFVGSGGTLGVSTSPFNVVSGNSDTQQPAVHIAIATDYAHLNNAQPAVHVDTQTPNVYTGNTGGGSALSIVPQYLAINFIIRYQ